jgi:hypothetical protein
MKSKVSIKSVIRIAAFLFAFLSLVTFSLVPAWAQGNSLFFPLIYRIMPSGPGLTSPLLITEVMYNPPGSEPGPEWIEVYNRSTETLFLEFIKIGDSETPGDAEGMYLFPQEAVITPGGVKIIANRASIFSQNFGFLPDFELADSSLIVPNMRKYKSWAGGVINLNNRGDEIVLLDHDDSILDSLSWGNSAEAFINPIPIVDEGHTIERRPADTDRNNAADWWEQTNPRPGTVDLSSPPVIRTVTNTPTEKICGGKSLLLSELVYDPIGVSEPSGEWFEVYNFGDQVVNLGCIKVGDEENPGGGEGMYIFPSEFMLPAGEVVVIANRADTFYSQFSFYPHFEIHETIREVLDMLKYNSWSTGPLNLSNSGDELLLLDDEDHLVDAVSWGNSTFAFDPTIPRVIEGSSLERRPANLDTDSAGDWIENADPEPGEVDLSVPTLPPSPTNTQTPTPTPTQTALPPPIFVINEIHADPHSDLGDANGDNDVDTADDEFVEIINNSAAAIDISGWMFRDYLSVRHVFPPGSEVAPGCGIIIFGGGSPTGSFGNCLVQVASSGSLGLNDHGDIVSLLNVDSQVVATYSYGPEAGDNQSITRDPDIIGVAPLVKHMTATGSAGNLFSPGNRIDGSFFSGCSK